MKFCDFCKSIECRNEVLQADDDGESFYLASKTQFPAVLARVRVTLGTDKPVLDDDHIQSLEIILLGRSGRLFTFAQIEKSVRECVEIVGCDLGAGADFALPESACVVTGVEYCEFPSLSSSIFEWRDQCSERQDGARRVTLSVAAVNAIAYDPNPHNSARMTEIHIDVRVPYSQSYLAQISLSRVTKVRVTSCASVRQKYGVAHG